MQTRKNDQFGREIPVYRQVSQILELEIQKRYKAGDVLPSEKDLAARFEVNRHTVRRAIGELVTQGIVGKLQGKGTIVQQKVINYSINQDTRFTQTLESCGRQPESLVIKKIGLQAEGVVAELLEIPPGKPVILVETLRKMDGAPFSVVSHYLPLEKVYEVMRTYRGGSLHGFLEMQYNLRLKRRLSLISAVLPDQLDQELLEITGNSPLLQVRSVNVDADSGEPVELSISRFKGVSTQLSIEPR